MDERHGPGATVTYAPEPGIYCRFDNYAFRRAGGRLVTISVRQSDVDEALRYARFASELFQDWGLTAPALPIEQTPAAVPLRFGSGEGYVMNVVPEIFYSEDPEDDPNGVFSSGSAGGSWLSAPELESRPGRLSVRFRPARTGDVTGETGPNIQRFFTVAHELFHAIQLAYYYETDIESLWYENWVTEGMADAMAMTAFRIFDEYDQVVPSGTATLAPLIAEPRYTHFLGPQSRRYTGFEGGLFATDWRAEYDTSSFWSHLFARQISDMRQVDGMYRALEGDDEGGGYVVDEWLRDTRAQSLPEAYQDFLQEIIRNGSFYDGTHEDQLLGCGPYEVTFPANGTRVHLHERPVVESQREALRGLRVSCYDYQVDASNGEVVVSLDAEFNGSAPSPHLQIFTGDTVLSAGETLTLAAGQTHTLRTVAFFSPVQRLAEPEDLILRDFAVRFEQSPQSACNTQTLALNNIANAWGTWDNGASQPDLLPEYGEAFIQATFGGKAIRGPACMRLILLDYGHVQGPALTVQLAHNPTNPYWGVPTGNWANINLHMPPGSFDPADLASGREIAFDQLIVIDGEPSSIATTSDQFSAGEQHPFISHFSTGPSPSTVGVFGHHLNESMTLRFEDAGQLSATGTFTFNTFGPRVESPDFELGPASGGGTFTVPITRLGLPENRATWGEECLVAMHEGRAWDAVMCARAIPDDANASNVLLSMDLFHSWLFYTYMQ
ncbi:hypothetical protein [Gymnodinialimonas sp.]